MQKIRNIKHAEIDIYLHVLSKVDSVWTTKEKSYCKSGAKKPKVIKTATGQVCETSRGEPD